MRSITAILLYAAATSLVFTLALPLNHSPDEAVALLSRPSSSNSGPSTIPELGPSPCSNNTLFVRQAGDAAEDYLNWLHDLSNEELGRIIRKSDGDLKNHELLFGELWRRFSDIIKNAQEEGLDEEQMMKKIFGDQYSFRPEY